MARSGFVLMGDWNFSLTHALTIVGWLVTIGVAYYGVQTFERWRREKIEEKRIDIAIEALALAYEIQETFTFIRSPGTQQHEYEDMPRRAGENDAEWSTRGPFFAILRRIDAHLEVFERLAKLRPRFMALFGVTAAENFQLVREARANVIVSAQWLCYRPITGPNADRRRTQFECDVWDGMAEVYLTDLPQANRVEQKVAKFVSETERLCRPIVDRSYAQPEPKISWRDYFGFAQSDR